MDHEPDHLAITLPGVPGAVPVARRRVRGILEGRGVPPGVVDDAVLAVSELATSAVHRQPAAFSLQLKLRGARIRIEVHHNGLTSQSPVGEPDLDEGRRISLAVLAGVAEIGHSIDAAGSLLWAELRSPTGLSDGNV
ncbi:ATP-binding protein [Kitasatospora sp. NPDC004272]